MTIATGLAANTHVCIAQSQDGVLYFANGTNAPLRWDGITALAELAGIAAPTASEMTSFAAAGSGSGSLTGEYKAFVRYIDDAGIPSSFSALPGESLSLSSNASVSYTGLPVSSNSRVVGREIWRNTHGQEVTWYLDATVANNSATTASSTKTDETLRSGTALRMYTTDGGPSAYRFTPPPSHFSVVANYMDRLWWSASTQAASRSTVMFSEASEPESVPVENALTLQEDGDSITGLIPMGPHLYVTKRGYVYRVSSAGDPRRDASAVLVADRGQINQRCNVRVEGQVFLMDQMGFWLFNGNSVTPIDASIRDFLSTRINWSRSKWFHAARAMDEEMVRFFVALDSDSYPQHALSYDYRRNRWYLDDYDGTSVKASGESTIGGMRRTVVGVSGDVNVLDQGTRDEGSEIDWSIKLGAFRFLPIEQNNRRELRLFFDPLPAGSSDTLYIQVYLDGSATPEVAEFALDGELGVTVDAASSQFNVDLTAGFAAMRLDGFTDLDAASHKFIEFELVGSSRRDTHFNAIEIDGVS